MSSFYERCDEKLFDLMNLTVMFTISCNLQHAQKVLPNASLVPGHQQCFRSFLSRWFWQRHCFVTGCRWRFPKCGSQSIINSKCTKPLPFSWSYSIFGAHTLHLILIRAPAVIQKTESFYINVSIFDYFHKGSLAKGLTSSTTTLKTYCVVDEDSCLPGCCVTLADKQLQTIRRTTLSSSLGSSSPKRLTCTVLTWRWRYCAPSKRL